FDELLDLPKVQRSVWFAEQTDLSSSDHGLLIELLETHDKAELSLDQPLPEVAKEAVSTGIVDVLIGAQLGPFLVGEEIGRGGMGVVYGGKRTDGEFEQDVVIKVLRIGVDSEAMRQRFVQERQILANLSHPSIVRLLDGGFTADGRPYIVMNWINGQRIDDYCNHNTLNLKARVRLFLGVIEAVDHAHAHLVIHRDIKPSNIWVDQDGKVHLLDFGIAKITDETDSPSITATMQRVMTPEYASPEQFRRGNITTATDIYQLGALLYQLLTGRQAFDLTGQSPAQMEQRVCEADPIAPSRAVTSTGADFLTESTTDQLKKLLSGDMDLILQKALRKEAERRYSSAHEFRQDLINWLSGDRVFARPNSLGYQLHRLVKRNLLATAFTVTLLVCGVAFTVFHVKKITAERDIARLEAERRREVSDFLVNLLKVPDPTKSEGREITARELIEDSFPRINDDLSDPETKARLLEVVGEVASNLGLYDQSGPALADVVRYKAEIYGPRSAEVATANIQLAVMHRLAQKPADALVPASDALSIRREIYPAGHIEIGRALKVVALIHRNLREFELAEKELREAKAIIDAELPETNVLHISVVADLAYVLRTVGQAEEAEQLYRQAITQMKARESDFSVELPSALNNLGYLIRKKGDLAEAEGYYREAIRRNESHHGKFHPLTLMFRNNLSGVLIAQGHEAAVIKELKTIIAMQEHLTGTDHWRMAVAYRSLGYYYYMIGEYQLAVGELRTSLQIFNSVLEPGHLWTMRTALQLSLCLDLTGSSEESEQIWGEVRPILATETAQKDRGVESLLSRLSDNLPEGNERWQNRLAELKPEESGD
ncbi:MAG: tetratricopeptide (TPR) repeat protein, partial [Candidatus Krumholzibacteriia bacterium]